MVTRDIHWVKSIGDEYSPELKSLEQRLKEYYSNNSKYYANIDFTSTNWVDKSEMGFRQIVALASLSSKICEIGCGSANILKHYSHFESIYSGCDFSTHLIQENLKRYPKAEFRTIAQPNILPYDDESFDFVFSVFVIEHSTNPSKFLDECARIIKPGGRLVILCPDFLGRGTMTSQRSGWSRGTASQKLKKGRWLDAIITLYDNRVKIPLYCKKMASEAIKSPQFLINLDPVVFQDEFMPDVDAVYVTFKDEMKTYLSKTFETEKNTTDLFNYEKNHGIIFLSLVKTSIG